MGPVQYDKKHIREAEVWEDEHSDVASLPYAVDLNLMKEKHNVFQFLGYNDPIHFRRFPYSNSYVIRQILRKAKVIPTMNCKKVVKGKTVFWYEMLDGWFHGRFATKEVAMEFLDKLNEFIRNAWDNLYIREFSYPVRNTKVTIISDSKENRKDAVVIIKSGVATGPNATGLLLDFIRKAYKEGVNIESSYFSDAVSSLIKTCESTRKKRLKQNEPACV